MVIKMINKVAENNKKKTSYQTICRLLLRELRLERNIKQAQIASGIGKTSSAWCKIESGDSNITLNHLVAVCRFLNINPSDLLRVADLYMVLLGSSGWQVYQDSDLLAKEEDLLSNEAVIYYSGNESRSQQKRTIDVPVLSGPYLFPTTYAPADVFRWVLERNK